ncbi:MAG: DUF3852 domain-containing protein [Clostridiales bacterium]|nr:DUF3852 domain-containing protein [Clostridiales bacterium]
MKYKKTFLILLVFSLVFSLMLPVFADSVADAVEGTVNEAMEQVKEVVNRVVFPVIDAILAIMLFAKIATAYMDYRKKGQFEFAPIAILLASLIFSLTCPLYIWQILA